MTNRQKIEKRRRRVALLPSGVPRYLHCYDNGGETIDRYTVVFTGRYRHLTSGEFIALCMSSALFSPQGVGQHGIQPQQIDRPTSSHLGKRIPFDRLPDDCKEAALSDYKYLWEV